MTEKEVKTLKEKKPPLQYLPLGEKKISAERGHITQLLEPSARVS
jgi:hypothetical protein